MSNRQWQADNYGTYMLKPASPEGEGYAWIQARRSYCDRGHWDWGFLGLAGQQPRPSYYFMRLETAIAELETWLARREGRSCPAPSTTLPPSGPMALECTLAASWERIDETSSRLSCALPDKSQVSLLLTSEDLPLGPWFCLRAESVPNLDDADVFPRYYTDAANAASEAEAFLRWRLTQTPAETPGPITLPSRPLFSSHRPPYSRPSRLSLR